MDKSHEKPVTIPEVVFNLILTAAILGARLIVILTMYAIGVIVGMLRP
jgi:hypothetical protein